MWFNARSHHSIFDEVLEHDEHRDLDHEYDISKPKFTFTECVVAIVASLILVTLLAVFLVEQIDEVVEAGIPDQFLGLILLPLAEKSAEHLTAIDEAWDGQMARSSQIDCRSRFSLTSCRISLSSIVSVPQSKLLSSTHP